MKYLAFIGFLFANTLFTTPVMAEEKPAGTSAIPITEKEFVDAINGFNKEQIIAQFGQPAKAEDVKIKDSAKVVASIWQYHNINKAADGSFYPTTELDFIDDKVVMVVFMNHDGTDIDNGTRYDLPENGQPPELVPLMPPQPNQVQPPIEPQL